MKETLTIDLQHFEYVECLWPQLVQRLGIDKSYLAVRQALDMQDMQGDLTTLPVLFYETCGLALIHLDLVSQYLERTFKKDNPVLILSIKDKTFQIIGGD